MSKVRKLIRDCKFKYFGVSPSGKASDSDSDISCVRITVPQPEKKRLSENLKSFFLLLDNTLSHLCPQLCKYHYRRDNILTEIYSSITNTIIIIKNLNKDKYHFLKSIIPYCLNHILLNYDYS